MSGQQEHIGGRPDWCPPPHNGPCELPWCVLFLRECRAAAPTPAPTTQPTPAAPADTPGTEAGE